MKTQEIPIFVVNLRRNTERKTYITKQLEYWRLQFNIMETVDGETLPAKDIQQAVDEKKSMVSAKRRKLAKAEVACVMSHKNIYRHIVTQKIPYAVILEDDICIKRWDIDMDYIQQMPQNWEVLLLGHHNGAISFTPYGRWQKKINKTIIRKPEILCYGAYGYVLTQKAAEKLLQLTTPILTPIDHVLSNNNWINVYIQQKPSILINDEFKSNIEVERSVFQQKSLAKSIITHLKLLKAAKMIKNFSIFAWAQIKPSNTKY